MSSQWVSCQAHRIHITVDGYGPGIILIAGTGQDASDWHRAGYVTGLADRFIVVCVDLPGQGRSVGSSDPDDYAYTSMARILNTVADHVGLPAFGVLGYSLGAALALRLGAFNQRVAAVFAMGTGLGNALEPAVVARSHAHAMAVHQAKLDGTLDTMPLTAAQRHTAEKLDIPAHLAGLHAALTWPPITTNTTTCPTMLYLGGSDLSTDKPTTPGRIRVHVEARLDHDQVFETADPAITRARAFFRDTWPDPA